MKVKLTSLIILFAVLSVSCSDDPENVLNLSAEKTTLSGGGHSGSFTVMCKTDWQITSSESWCSVHPAQGSGTATIHIAGKKNDSVEERTAVLTVASAGEKKTFTVIQPGASLALAPLELRFGAEGGTQKVSLTGKGIAWEVSAPAGVTITPGKGNADAELAVTVSPNTIRKEQLYTVSVTSGDIREEIQLTQAEGPNNDPEKPVLNAPGEGAAGVPVMPEFSWIAASDADGDDLTYQVLYSKDRTEWRATSEIRSVRTQPDEPLDVSATYYWKVRVWDDFGGEAESEVRSFSTSDIPILPNGSYSLYSGALPLNGTIPVIFTGDGFTPEECAAGGLFDRKADEGIEAFFSVEPYITYRECFKAYKIVAHSYESGASHWDEANKVYLQKKITAFDTRYYGDGYTSTKMTADCDKVFTYAKKIPGITDEVLDNTTVVLIVNDPVYSGTCWIYTSGRSVAIVPTCDENQPYTYRMTMVHEASGHGFGRLGDEYRFSDNPITAEERENLIYWSNLGNNPNIDVTGDPAKVKWRRFFNQPGYEAVGLYEGAQYISGVWKPENSSAMGNMQDLYFNAPSREAVVKRIMKNIGQAYSFDAFKGKDIITRPDTRTYGSPPAVRRIPAHTPPQLWR